jgi:hypothetical protein
MDLFLRDFVFPQLSGWRHFISFSQLAATLTIANINKKVIYEAFFDWLKRKQKSFKQGA